MTVHSITTDLTLMNDAQGGTWGELSNPFNAGGSATINDLDYFVQDTGCVSQSLSASKSGLIFSLVWDNGSDLAGSFATDDCVFMWQVLLAGNAMDTWANGGLRMFVGLGQGDGDVWQCGGSDFGRNPYGGWQNVAVDPTVTPDYTIGTPTAVWRWFGSIVNTIATISKGNLHGVDVLRRGRGELIIEFGTGADPETTFTDISDDNDAIANRWGLFKLEGGSFQWKGLMSFGNATNEVEFTSANDIIFIDDTPRTFAAFNRIEINNTSSVVNWTSVSITAPNTSVDGTVLSRGQLEVVDNAEVTFIACTFTDMSTFIFNDGANANTITDTTFRRTGQITTGGATMSGCVFEDITSATHVLALTLADAIKVSESTFDSDGTGNGLQIGDGTTVLTTQTITLTDLDFIGYDQADPGTAANKAVYLNSDTGGGVITLNISGGSGLTETFHVRTTNCTVAVSADVTVTFTNLKDNSEVRIYTAGTNTELAGIENATAGSLDERTFAAAIPGTTSVDYVIINFLANDDINYLPIRVNAFTWPSADQNLVINQVIDRNVE